MATTLKELIEDIEKDDLPTNEFTIEDEDPMVILGKINEVIASLKMIQDTISSSDTKAQEALTTAIQSLETANKALSSSNVSLETANQAIATANQAIATANTALQESQNAVDTSNQANNTANTAETNALEALKVAQEALDQVVQGLGTKAYINGDLQNRLDFTKDPQTQINDISTHIETFAPHTATQNHTTSGVQPGWYQVANLKTQGNYDIKIKQAYNYNYPEAIHLSISINNSLSTAEPFASITQLSGVNPASFALSKIRVRQGTDEGTTYLDVYNPDRLWNTTWVDITSDTRDVVVEPNTPFQFIGTEDNPSGYKVSTLDLVNGFNTSYLNVSDTVTFSGRVSDLNTISQPVNSTVTYSFGGGCANAPTTDSGMVIQYQESTAFCTQLVIANDADASTWRRSYRDGTWTAWEKLSKLKSRTFTSTNDFYNFMQNNIDSVKEVVITPTADITGKQTVFQINKASGASSFDTSSNISILDAYYEYRCNQFFKDNKKVMLQGMDRLVYEGENNIVLKVMSTETIYIDTNSVMLSDANFTVIQGHVFGKYNTLTYKVYYFD